LSRDKTGNGSSVKSIGGATSDDGRWTINTPATIEDRMKSMTPEQRVYFSSALDAGGGIEGQRAHLRPAGEEYYLTSSSDNRASGNFLTKEYPGDTPQERKENLQLPPENDASVVEKVQSQKAILGFPNVEPFIFRFEEYIPRK
jgi:hypothetical protein